jgi:hypothetical protein
LAKPDFGLSCMLAHNALLDLPGALDFDKAVPVAVAVALVYGSVAAAPDVAPGVASADGYAAAIWVVDIAALLLVLGSH